MTKPSLLLPESTVFQFLPNLIRALFNTYLGMFFFSKNYWYHIICNCWNFWLIYVEHVDFFKVLHNRNVYSKVWLIDALDITYVKPLGLFSFLASFDNSIFLNQWVGGRFSIIFLVPEIMTANEISVAPRILKHPGICCKYMYRFM